jgi:hypothetical protein
VAKLPDKVIDRRAGEQRDVLQNGVEGPIPPSNLFKRRNLIVAEASPDLDSGVPHDNCIRANLAGNYSMRANHCAVSDAGA